MDRMALSTLCIPGDVPGVQATVIIPAEIYSLRKETLDLGSPFDTSGRTGLTARAEVSKHEHLAELFVQKRNILSLNVLENPAADRNHQNS